MTGAAETIRTKYGPGEKSKSLASKHKSPGHDKLFKPNTSSVLKSTKERVRFCLTFSSSALYLKEVTVLVCVIASWLHGQWKEQSAGLLVTIVSYYYDNYCYYDYSCYYCYYYYSSYSLVEARTNTYRPKRLPRVPLEKCHSYYCYPHNRIPSLEMMRPFLKIPQNTTRFAMICSRLKMLTPSRPEIYADADSAHGVFAACMAVRQRKATIPLRGQSMHCVVFFKSPKKSLTSELGCRVHGGLYAGITNNRCLSVGRWNNQPAKPDTEYASPKLSGACLGI